MRALLDHIMSASAANRIFTYCRVSTKDQTTTNQLDEIRAAGFVIRPAHIVVEVVSGSVAAFKRPAFLRLVEKLKDGDVLAVAKLDQLGRNAEDVRTVVQHLASQRVRVYCLALGPSDLTSVAGKTVMQFLVAMASFERELRIERTHAASSAPKVLGRLTAITEPPQEGAEQRLKKGGNAL